MSQTSQSKKVSLSVLKSLVPINAISSAHQEEIASMTSVKYVKAETKVIKQGQSDSFRIYLLSGLLAIESPDSEPRLIKGGDKEAMYPIDHHQPHRVTAITKTNAAFIILKDEVVENYLALDQVVGLEVDDIDDEQADDWMTKMLCTKTFSAIPPPNIQAMFMRLDSISARPGEVIISQGEDGEHFYIISKGKCKVTRKEGDSGEEKLLAELNVGGSFGEEALLSDDKRNATVTMLTDGTVMRLKRSDFEELLKEPIVNYVDYAEALSLAEKGHMLLDVRLESEHEKECIEGSINIPLNMIRNEIENLATDAQYIVYCDTGARSATAAFLLNEHGIKATIIQGGLRSQNAA